MCTHFLYKSHHWGHISPCLPCKLNKTQLLSLAGDINSVCMCGGGWQTDRKEACKTKQKQKKHVQVENNKDKIIYLFQYLREMFITVRALHGDFKITDLLF